MTTLEQTEGTTADSGIRVLHTLSGLHVAGIGRLLLQNIVALRQLDVTNIVCYMTPTHDLQQEYFDAGFDPICLNYRSKIKMLPALFRLINIIRNNKVDIIHTNHLIDRNLSILAGTLTHTPVITTFHDTTGRDQKIRARGRLNMAADSLFYKRRMTGYIAVSQAVADIAAESYGLPRESIRVIYSGVDPEIYDTVHPGDRKSEIQESLGLAGKYPVLINVGRLHAVKGQRHLVPMMMKLRERWPEARLLIAGQGELEQELRSQIADAHLQDHITLLGRRSDIPDLLRSADIFVFPSESEGLGMAVIEAMAAGLPVVAADVGPLNEVVQHHKTGVLVEPRNPEALADGVTHIIDGNHAREYGHAGRSVVDEKFNSMKTAGGMKSFYLSCVSR